MDVTRERGVGAVQVGGLDDLFDCCAALYAEADLRDGPGDTHVLVVVDLAPLDGDTVGGPAVLHTWDLLHVEFPAVSTIAVVDTWRFAVLARRHPGLAKAVTVLDERLATHVASAAATAVWCEKLPDRADDLARFLNGVVVKPATRDQDARDSLAGSPSPEPDVAVDDTGARRVRRMLWQGQAPLATAAAAVVVVLAGTGIVGAAHAPWRNVTQTTANTRTLDGKGPGGAGAAPSSPPGFFSPGVLEELGPWMRSLGPWLAGQSTAGPSPTRTSGRPSSPRGSGTASSAPEVPPAPAPAPLPETPQAPAPEPPPAPAPGAPDTTGVPAPPGLPPDVTAPPRAPRTTDAPPVTTSPQLPAAPTAPSAPATPDQPAPTSTAPVGPNAP